MDMLSANKIKLHGMKDYRWRTQDKISQYKGLISLYKRDRKIGEADSGVQLKKEKRMLAALKKDIVHSRADLDNAVFGDRQRVRNVLAEDKSLQLAYQHLPVERIIEHIYQENFHRRKQLDLLSFRMQQKGNCLINLKLRSADLVDRISYDVADNVLVKLDKTSKLLTAMYQDAILKKEAAIVVNASYKKIVNVMKKDSTYFDSILYTLRHDVCKQNKCMVDTVNLGQLATEYLDDRKGEFAQLEVAVQKSMVKRNARLQETRRKVKTVSKSIRFFIRRDSDVNLPKHRGLLLGNGELKSDLDFITVTLDSLKEVSYVTDYQMLFPRVVEQAKQRERLEELRDACDKNRDILRSKLKHAEAAYFQKLHTVNDTVIEYKEEKKRLLDQLQTENDKIKQCVDQNASLGDKITKVNMYLQQMEQVCKIVRDPKDKKQTVKLRSSSSVHAAAAETLQVHEDPLKIVELLAPTLTRLMAADTVQMDAYGLDKAREILLKLTSNRKYSLNTESVVIVESLFEDVRVEDASVPSRQDIKALSARIVAASATNEDDISWHLLKRK